MKRAAAIVLILCLTLGLAAAPDAFADDTGIYYIALNESFVDSALAYFSGGSVYVPISSLVGFRIYSSYHSANSTASLFNSTKQFYFEIETGNTYDSNDNYYDTSAISRNGQVYVPLGFVCSQFGLSYSLIEGVGYGNVCRIKDSSYILTDSQFLTAAEIQMRSMYNAYSGSGSGGIDDSGNQDSENGGSLVYLSFQGLPTGTIFELLHDYEMPACFFLTVDELRSAPDTVRRIIGEGFTVGALLGVVPEAEYGEFSELLFEIARVKTLLVSGSTTDYVESVAAYAVEQGLVYWDYSVDGVRSGNGISYASMITAYVDYLPDRADVRIQCTSLTESCLGSVLLHFEEGNFNVRAPNEVEAS